MRSPLHRCVAVHHRASSAARRGGARCAFTLIELLVVVAIVALLLAILAPNLQMARQKAIESVCGSTLRGMMVGIQGYMIENRDYFPPWGHVWYRGDRPAVSTAYAAVLNRGKYTGPTWCPNYSEGSPVGVPDRAGDIREIKEAERQDRFGYAYNLQVGNLVQDPATGEYIEYDPVHGTGLDRTESYALPAHTYSELKRPSEFALMGCGGRWQPYVAWSDSGGIQRQVPFFQSLHGRYDRFRPSANGPMRGPRQRGNIIMADGHVESFFEPEDMARYAERYYLWPQRDY